MSFIKYIYPLFRNLKMIELHNTSTFMWLRTYIYLCVNE